MSDRDVTCVPDDYTAKLMAEVTRLQDENHKLQEQLAEWKRVAEFKQDIIDHMRDANAENAKLRKLVRGLDYCSDELDNAECDRCPLHDMADGGLGPTCVRLMEELGIEEDA